MATKTDTAYIPVDQLPLPEHQEPPAAGCSDCGKKPGNGSHAVDPDGGRCLVPLNTTGLTDQA